MGYLRAHALLKSGGLVEKGGKLNKAGAGRTGIAVRRQRYSSDLGKSLPEMLENEAEKMYCASASEGGSSDPVKSLEGGRRRLDIRGAFSGFSVCLMRYRLPRQYSKV